MFRKISLFSIFDLINNKNDEKSDKRDTNSVHTTINPPKDAETSNEEILKKDLKSSATEVTTNNNGEVDVHRKESDTKLSKEKVEQRLARSADATTFSSTFLSPR